MYEQVRSCVKKWFYSLMTYLIDFVNFIILMEFISKSYELEIFAKTGSFHVVVDRYPCEAVK